MSEAGTAAHALDPLATGAEPAGWRPGRAAAVIAVAGAALSSLIPMALVPALPSMAKALEGRFSGALLAQLVIAAPAVMIAIVSPFAGVAAARLGLRRCLLLALGLYVIAGLAGLFFKDAGILVASRMILGGASGLIGTLAMTLAGMFDPKKRDRLIGFSSAAGSISAVLALNVSGLLVDMFGWRAPFALYLLGIPILLIAFAGIGREAGRNIPAAQNHALTEASLLRGDQAPLFPFYLLMLIFSVGFFMPGIQGPFLLLARGTTSAATQGMLISIMAATAALSALSYGSLTRRLNTRHLVMLAGITLGTGLITCGIFAHPAAIAAGFMLTGLGAGFATPTIMTGLVVAVHPSRRARALGLNYTAIFAGQFLNPLLLAPLIQGFGIGPAFAFTGAVIVFVAFIVAVAAFPGTAVTGGARPATQ